MLLPHFGGFLDQCAAWAAAHDHIVHHLSPGNAVLVAQLYPGWAGDADREARLAELAAEIENAAGAPPAVAESRGLHLAIERARQEGGKQTVTNVLPALTQADLRVRARAQVSLMFILVHYFTQPRKSRVGYSGVS